MSKPLPEPEKPKVSLKLMLSDKIATIEDGIHEKVTLEDEENVMEKVHKYMEENYVTKREVKLKEISILLLSYWAPPSLPNGIQCPRWFIECQSHTPYVLPLVEAVTENCDYLEVQLEMGGLDDYLEVVKSKHIKSYKLKSFVGTEPMEIKC